MNLPTRSFGSRSGQTRCTTYWSVNQVLSSKRENETGDLVVPLIQSEMATGEQMDSRAADRASARAASDAKPVHGLISFSPPAGPTAETKGKVSSRSLRAKPIGKQFAPAGGALQCALSFRLTRAHQINLASSVSADNARRPVCLPIPMRSRASDAIDCRGPVATSRGN